MLSDVLTSFRSGQLTQPLVVSSTDLFESIRVLFGREFWSVDELCEASVTDLVFWDFSENGKVEHVRWLLQKVAHRPQGSYQVFVLLEVDNLTDQAANALLKTLEDVSSHSLFLLTSSAPHRLLPTIQSRVRVVSFDGQESLWDDQIHKDVRDFVYGDQVPLISRILGTKIDRSQCQDIVRALQNAIEDGSIREPDLIDRILTVSERLETSNVTAKYQVDTVLFPLLSGYKD